MQEEKNTKKGGIAVDTEHIFPIIKKWLYSEKDIFLREIVSNATDAITKLKRLESLGIKETESSEMSVTVLLDEENKTVSVRDTGIGMTEEELVKYLGNIALSGAVDFIQKYENEGGKNGIIGHFGLGFYSAFMVSDKVEVTTKSYTDAPAVTWVCNEAGEYEITPADKADHGTVVTMHISEEESGYLSETKLKSMLDKYCSFMPQNVYFEKEGEEVSEKKPINDKTPLWLKNPSDCTEEEYKEFYRKVFGDYKDPLFHIHINADYPLNFKGILYFPRLANDYEAMEGQVKLYYNQVFVADNIKEVIPEYFLMLKGVLDCPELPLNVSRSYLQTNTYVSKVSAHITKKVADKLNSLCLNEREKYEGIWKDISAVIEFSCMRDKKFYDRVKKSLLLPLTDGKFNTFDEYFENGEQSEQKTVYYATDKAMQAQYISMYNAKEIKVALYERPIDTQFAALLEQYMEGVKFLRIDADSSALKAENAEDYDTDGLKTIFEETVAKGTKVSFEALADENVPALLGISEQSRRMEEMMRLYGMGEMPEMPQDATFVVNTASPLIKKLAETAKTDPEGTKSTAAYVYKLSLLSQKKFTAEEMQGFLKDSVDLLMKL